MKTISLIWGFTCAQPNHLWVLVNTLVMNLLMHFEEFFELIMCMISLDKRPYEVSIKIMYSVILENHIMHDDTHISWRHTFDLYITCSSKVENNIRTSLEHTKCPLHILSTTFLVVVQREIFCYLEGLDIVFRNVTY
jgi:hypothetical protein